MAVNNSLAPKMREVNELQPKNNNAYSVSNIGTMSSEREVKALEIAMVTAKRFPRDMVEVEDKIARNCNRLSLANLAEYSYSRAGTAILGASINLLKVIAQCYGNIDFGTNEIQRYGDYSECEAYAWDFETNTKTSRKFTVPHYRDTKGGKTRLLDDRDIREMINNFGSRNVRSCLESIIPRDIIDTAREICNKTINSGGKAIGDLIAGAKTNFRNSYGIDSKDLEALIGVEFAKWTKAEYNQAVKFFNALNEGETSIAQVKEIVAKNRGEKSKGKEKSNDPLGDKEWDRLSKKHNVALKQQSLDESDPLV